MVNIFIICDVFLCFEAVLGLVINLLKSEIIPIGEVDDIDSLDSLFGCSVARLPMKFWVFLWGRLVSRLIYGMVFSRIWKGGWRVGRGFICRREGG
jgi:hypothetical protein